MEQEQEQQELMWRSGTPVSMVSVTIGRAMAALLSARSRKLYDSISRFSPDNTIKKPSSLTGSLEESLWFLHKYIKDAVELNQKLDDILIPIIQHVVPSLRSKNSKHGGQEMILMNWLFQEEFVFEAVAKNLTEIIVRKEDRYVALGWCVLVRGLVEYENFMDQYTLSGIRNNYTALLETLVSCFPYLSRIVCKGSTLQDGYELPFRLAVSAADCILAISEALTKMTKMPSSKPKLSNSNPSNQSITLAQAASGEKKVKPTSKLSEISNIEVAYLLWNQIEELITLLQRLLAWSKKSRPLHAKGVEQVLKWLQEIKEQHGCVQDETGRNIIKTSALLLSSCWKHYSILLFLEDHRFSHKANELLDQYVSGIQYYVDSNSEGHIENKDSGIETKKFFLNCLCLLLGRYDRKKFESAVSEYRMQLSSVLLSQLQCTDEDVVAGAVSIFKAAVFSSERGLTHNAQMDAMMPLLLNLLDERDGAARAVVMLIAEYCSMSTENHCLQQVLKRLASGNLLQRRNAIDVISELVFQSSDSTNKLSNLAWEDIANNLLDRLRDEEILIREQASNLLARIDPSLVLPALVKLLYSSDAMVHSSASAVFIALLKHHSQKPEVICQLLDCISNLSQNTDYSKTTEVREGPKMDIDKILKLIPEWSKSVEDWKSLIGPLLEKMFAEPANATIVRFLSYISEHLEEAVDMVLYRVMLQMKEQEDICESLVSQWNRSYANKDSVKMQQSLFERLCPLLVVRMLPLRVFNDLDSPIMYAQLPNQATAYEYGDIRIIDQECVAALLLKRAFADFEFEDVRKLAAEICGRIHPLVLFPIVSSTLEHAAGLHDTLKIKACLFSVCTSLVVRGKDSVSHPVILKIKRTIEMILLWPSLDGDEVSKAQHGCIDCLALMICAELQAPGSFKDSSENSSIVGKTDDSGDTALGKSILAYVIHQLINDKNEVVSTASLSTENRAFNVPVASSFRLCLANALISACQKISDAGKRPFARKTIPCLIHSAEKLEHSEIRAGCIQVLFSAVYHLKSEVLPYSSDLFKLSLNILRKGSEKERMAGAKLMASLMASEDAILATISGGLLEARSILSTISSSDPSRELREICSKLLLCITSP